MHVDKTRFERRYSISVETKRPLVDVSDQSTVKQLRRNYGAIENAFNTGSPKLVRARPDRRPCRVGRRTHAVFVPCGVPWTDRIHCTTYTITYALHVQLALAGARARARRYHSTRNAFARRRRRHFQWRGLCTKCYSFSAVASTLDWSLHRK